MSRFVIRAEPITIFLTFLSAMVVYGLIPNELETLKSVGLIFLSSVIIGWFFILGRSLNQNLPEDKQKNDTFFEMSCFVGILLASTFAVLKDVELDESLIEYLILLYAFFAISFLYMIYFTSVLFIENQERLLAKDRLKPELSFILFIGFILGVLILQSRVRKIFES